MVSASISKHASLNLPARAVIKFVLWAASTLENTDGKANAVFTLKRLPRLTLTY